MSPTIWKNATYFVSKRYLDTTCRASADEVWDACKMEFEGAIEGCPPCEKGLANAFQRTNAMFQEQRGREVDVMSLLEELTL